MVKDYVLILAGGTHGIYLLEDLPALLLCTEAPQTVFYLLESNDYFPKSSH